MRRRVFIATLATELAAPGSVRAQQAGSLPRIGYATLNARAVTVEAFEQGLRQLGYVLGQNIVIEYRFAEGHLERIQALVSELLKTGIDVLFAANPHAIRAAVQAKAAVPIVGIDLETDPVRAGWVKTLARPGGNVTGFFLDIPELSAKQVQFLIEAIPACSDSRSCGTRKSRMPSSKPRNAWRILQRSRPNRSHSGALMTCIARSRRRTVPRSSR